MQAALSHTNVIHNRENRAPSPSFARAAAKPATQPLPAYFIPTPDANGQADDYDSLLPAGRVDWSDPKELIKFSEKVEECCYGWGGLNYEMDDADVEWLRTFNGKEEGSSADGAAGSASAGRSARQASSSAGSNAKGKEKDAQSGSGSSSGPMRIAEDVFEYVMGMLELWTEKNVPMLHTDLSLLPPLVSIEPVFKTTPPASYFPSFERPLGLPAPSLLVKMASRIYPHWKSRKEQRKGRSIIPQLNFDEANESDPYLCFRRRDLKVQRKTRIKDTTPVNRLEQVQTELTQATFLVNMVLLREKEKQRAIRAEREVWDARWNLLDVKRKNPTLPPMTQEEETFLFPHRNLSSVNGQAPAKRQRVGGDREGREREEAARSAMHHHQMQGGTAGLSTSMNQHGLQQKGLRSRAVSPAAEKVPPEQLAGLIAEKVEKEMRRKREIDRFAEEITGVTYQPLPQTAPLRYFRCLPATDRVGSTLSAGARRGLAHDGQSEGDEVVLSNGKKPTSERSESGAQAESHLPAIVDVEKEKETNMLREVAHPARPPNHQICFRLRRGRGGVMRLDRKMPTVRHIALSQSKPISSSGPPGTIVPEDPFRKLFPNNPLARRSVFESDSSDDEDDDDDGENEPSRSGPRWEAEEEERARMLSERWRYDYDGGLVGVGMGVKDEDQVVIDDYETR